jgi:hypothetical protein|tara:strand:+ start:1315 stop:1416 length:102 start_codon:yes stop_codon:yes gene_type:complete
MTPFLLAAKPEGRVKASNYLTLRCGAFALEVFV